MPLPELDAATRAAALEKAKEARRIRAELKLRLKSGEIPLVDVLARVADSPVLAKMRVIDVLEAMPAVGKITAVKVMEELRISPSRRLQGLGPRQRAALLERFGAGS